MSFPAPENFTIIEADESHIPIILKFIRQLADYEKLSDNVVATEDLLRQSLFGERRSAEVLIVYCNDAPAGFAVFFHNFSTFLGRPGVYLEDLFVDPAFRGRGFGKALFTRLAQLAIERGCGRLDWSVLDWNEPAIGFYRSLGAVPLNEWTTFRLSGPALEEMARGESLTKT